MSTLQFPANPMVGDTYDWDAYKYVWDGEKWKTVGIGYNPVNDLKEAITELGGELDPTAEWSAVPAHSDAEIGGSMNAQAEALAARTKLLHTEVMEALRRSYAEAGYNVVGTFQAGFTLVNASDVGVDLATGKGFTGPAGFVTAGTDPASGGFVNVSDVVFGVSTVAGVAQGIYGVGTRLTVADRDSSTFVVTAGGTPNGWDTLDAGNGNVATLGVSSGIITAKSFGLKADGSDETAGLYALRNYMNANRHLELVLNQGTYTYSVSPNWSIPDLSVRTAGRVNFNCTGAGDCLIFSNPSGTTSNVKWCWDGDFYILGEPTTRDGLFVESTHHSKINVNVRGCGRYAQNVEFSVSSEYAIVASINHGPWYNGARPTRGVNVTRRGTGQNFASANTWVNPIIEGINGVGMLFDYALMNHINGGTSEGNELTNVVCTENSRDNKFNGTDLEVPKNGIGLLDAGRRNTFTELLNDAETIIASTAIGSTLRGGIYDVLTIQGRASNLDDLAYGAKGGELLDTGIETTLTGVFDIESASFKVPNKSLGVSKFRRELVTGAWAAPATVPGSVTKTVAVAGVNVGAVITAAPFSDVGDMYTIKYSVPSNGNIKIVITQNYGSPASPYPSGVTFRADISQV